MYWNILNPKNRGLNGERIRESAEVAQVRRADGLQPSCQQSTEAQRACNSLYYCGGSRTSKGMCTGKEPPVSCTVHQLQLDRPAGAQWRFIHGGLHGCLSDASRARNALGRCKRRLRSYNQLLLCCPNVAAPHTCRRIDPPPLDFADMLLTLTRSSTWCPSMPCKNSEMLAWHLCDAVGHGGQQLLRGRAQGAAVLVVRQALHRAFELVPHDEVAPDAPPVQKVNSSLHEMVSCQTP